MTRRRSFARVGAFLILLCAPAAAAPPQSIGDPAALEAFYDGAVRTFLADFDIAGATVSVVHGDRVVFAKGYGRTAQDADGVPVDPERTLFRIGSVSKLFLATAIMQLVEQGQLDLDRDVNDYLTGVKIPEAFGEPITLAHLMAHTAGFEESTLGWTWADGPDDLAPLAEVLASYLPARIRAPGELAAYSNHGTALAGLAVEQVSGLSYDEYLETHILEPLEMTRTTSRQPIPEVIDGIPSRGTAAPDEFAYVRIPPAGSMSSTATDIARFMSAHLGDGALGSARILKAPTARRMRETLFAHDPRVAGMAHQFFEHRFQGQRIVGHGGGTLWHRTSLLLVPEHGLGFFASFSSGTAPTEHFEQALLEYVFPTERAAPVPIAAEARSASRVAGWYRPTRRSETSPTRIQDLVTMGHAIADAEGRLSFAGETWIETEPGRFDRLDGWDHLVVQEPVGEEPRMFLGNLGAVALERVPFWQGTLVQVAWFLVALLLLLRPLASPLVNLRRLREADAVPNSVVMALAIVTLVFVVTFGLGVAHTAASFGGVNTAMRIALGLGYVMGGLAVVAVLLAGRAWFRSGSVIRRIGLTMTALAAVAMVAWLDHWNLFLHRL